MASVRTYWTVEDGAGKYNTEAAAIAQGRSRRARGGPMMRDPTMRDLVGHALACLVILVLWLAGCAVIGAALRGCQ